MKNIHILDTEKPSRLQLNVNTKKLILFDNIQSNNESVHLTTQHIYITSDEDIKEGDWVLGGLGDMVEKWQNYFTAKWKKIILTTDQDLIKDGVQSIGDEFLEWFVNNPSCEFVEVEIVYETGNIHQNDGFDNYEIIIPKEEPKQELLPDFKITKNIFDFVNDLSDTKKEEPKQETLEEDTYSKILKATMVPKEYFGTKQETLEEAAENHQKNTIGIALPKHTFIEGAKWQQEQDKDKYSEEEVLTIIRAFDKKFYQGIAERNGRINEWFEQFKNK